MNPLQIQINGMAIQLGAPLPSKIHHLSIQLLFPIQLPIEQSSLVKQWLNQIIDNLDCEYISYNNILIPSKDLKKF